jgi:DUF1680 family protein
MGAAGMKMARTVALLLSSALLGGAAHAAELFPLRDVRLGPSPFLQAQTTDLHYLMALEPDRLAAPYLREAGLAPRQPSYGNWESSGLDGHMGGHYLSALALMFASTGDTEVKRRLDYFVAELGRAQQANDNGAAGAEMRGYLGGIPGGRAAWRDIAAGKLHADGFSVNGKWVPWYNLHKLFAGLRDAYRYAGNEDARAMLIKLSDWALRLTGHLSDEQMQAMLKSEHGGMNEVLADVYQMTGQRKYLDLALRFSDRRILKPLEKNEDTLTGLHANTQIPKVIGFKRIAALSGDKDMAHAAEFFWQTVVDNRTVAIGGNSVKEHFHDAHDFSPMIDEVEGPETCNTYNMLKLTELLFAGSDKALYADYYERALYNHILASQHPDSGGFVYFTPMRPNQYRVYSQVDQAMWCCVGSGIESHAKYGEFIYAHEGSGKDAFLFVNLFIPSTLAWKEQGVRITQANSFPDEAGTHLTVDEVGPGARFAMKIRYPAWVAPGRLALRVNGKPVHVDARPGSYLSIERAWRKGDRVDVDLPMAMRLEQMPDLSHYYAVLYGPIVLAAKTNPFPTEHLNFLADDTRMGHVPAGQVCPLEAAPTFVADSTDFVKRFKPVPGKPLTFTAPNGVVQGGAVFGTSGISAEFIPFFRLHDSRYVVYFPQSTPGDYARTRADTAARETERLALDARTVDQVAPGEQQPEVDHLFKGEGAESGVDKGRHWRRAGKWFSYQLSDPKHEAKLLRLTLARADAGKRFAIVVNGQQVAEVELAGDAAQPFYTRDVALPAALVQGSAGKLDVKFVSKDTATAAPLYGLRLIR